MKIKVYQHFNLRLLGEIDLTESQINALITPRPEQKGRPHVIQVLTTLGPMTLFRVVGNGKPYVVTPQSQIAQAVISGGAKCIAPRGPGH